MVIQIPKDKKSYHSIFSSYLPALLIFEALVSTTVILSKQICNTDIFVFTVEKWLGLLTLLERWIFLTCAS